ncbi:hypothetical protein CYLTODRAFT_454235 [Cylindrobasidium torrendii FP15055 ss-10]|uniref:Uncharacterized protein n=1 Tax=Cylindrobasidium torrendii FP15055 ss-10 TaxID=1314674 RepID=A0A0D7BBV2_9AGAR|nr:hypothetical protein CYLTODRAFT_454235 [Cylindrobasidium torrendii FP15055 ss-10]
MADLASALLCGGCVAFTLSGVLGLQVFHYLRLHKTERWTRVAALICCFIDFAHSAFTFLALFHHLAVVPQDLSDTVHYSVPAALVFTINAGFAVILHTHIKDFLYPSTKEELVLDRTIVNQLIHRADLHVFLRRRAAYLAKIYFLLRACPRAALSLSTALDVTMTILACTTLRRIPVPGLAKPHRAPNVRTQALLGSGLLASVSTGSAMLCWVSAPTHFFYLGLLCVVGKVHANTLIFDFHFARDPICTDLPRHAPTTDPYTPPLSPVPRRERKRMESLTTVSDWASMIHVPKNALARSPPPSPPRIEVMVERTVEYGVGAYSPSTWCRPTSTVTSLASSSDTRQSGARVYTTDSVHYEY